MTELNGARGRVLALEQDKATLQTTVDAQARGLAHLACPNTRASGQSQELIRTATSEHLMSYKQILKL